MKDYLLQNPEELKQILIKYRFLMAESGFTVEDLMALNGTGVQELMRFNPEKFYHDYVGRKNLLPAYAKLVLNIGVLNRGMLREVATNIAMSSAMLTEQELLAKLMELDGQYSLNQQVEAPNQFVSAFAAPEFNPLGVISKTVLDQVPEHLVSTNQKFEKIAPHGEIPAELMPGAVGIRGGIDGVIPPEPLTLIEEPSYINNIDKSKINPEIAILDLFEHEDESFRVR